MFWLKVASGIAMSLRPRRHAGSTAAGRLQLVLGFSSRVHWPDDNTRETCLVQNLRCDRDPASGARQGQPYDGISCPAGWREYSAGGCPDASATTRDGYLPRLATTSSREAPSQGLRGSRPSALPRPPKVHPTILDVLAIVAIAMDGDLPATVRFRLLLADSRAD
jgi:hypothetical protein